MHRRSYVQDTETALYYLQSRYYDPELGRFINADAYASTGQGVLGNNMFAYCLNNPVVLVDSSGNAAHIGFGYDGQQNYAPWKIGSPGGGGWSQDLHCYKQDFKEKAMPSEYNGVEVIAVSFMRNSAFSLGKIYVSPNLLNDETVLAHEYGHYLQLQDVGMEKYLQFVALPSVTCWVLTELKIISSDVYYNKPWECMADIYGNVSRNHAEGAEESALSYWEIVKSFDYPVIP